MNIFVVITQTLFITAAPNAEVEDPPIGVFAGIEWRGMYAADHLSHGPGVHLGMSVLDGHLRFGLTGFARPGAINPTTFEVTPAGGSYKGQATLSLRSDGGMFGVFVAPAFDLPWLPLTVELPIALHQGGYGFYLTGEDRKTPDGRRVSAWENELLGGRDSFIGFGVEAGMRVALALEAEPWIRPFVGVHYSTVLGFDTLVKASYGGVGLALGVQLGRF